MDAMSEQTSEDRPYGSIVVTCKEGEKIVIGDSVVTLMQVCGAKVGKAVKIHVKADKKLPVYRVKRGGDV